MNETELVARLYDVRELMEAPSSGIAEARLERLILEVESTVDENASKERAARK